MTDEEVDDRIAQREVDALNLWPDLDSSEARTFDVTSAPRISKPLGDLITRYMRSKAVPCA